MEIQQQYYNEFIAKHPNWTLVRIYADEGISATSVPPLHTHIPFICNPRVPFFYQQYPPPRNLWTLSSVTYILGNDRYCGDVIMQKSLCVDLFAHKRVRNLGQVERYRMRDVHPPLISKEEWREAKNRISMPDREAVILEEITGEGILSSLHPILFKEDIDV